MGSKHLLTRYLEDSGRLGLSKLPFLATDTHSHQSTVKVDVYSVVHRRCHRWHQTLGSVSRFFFVFRWEVVLGVVKELPYYSTWTLQGVPNGW